jgi:hypothetical protein
MGEQILQWILNLDFCSYWDKPIPANQIRSFLTELLKPAQNRSCLYFAPVSIIQLGSCESDWLEWVYPSTSRNPNLISIAVSAHLLPTN